MDGSSPEIAHLSGETNVKIKLFPVPTCIMKHLYD